MMVPMLALNINAKTETAKTKKKKKNRGRQTGHPTFSLSFCLSFNKPIQFLQKYPWGFKVIQIHQALPTDGYFLFCPYEHPECLRTSRALACTVKLPTNLISEAPSTDIRIKRRNKEKGLGFGDASQGVSHVSPEQGHVWETERKTEKDESCV